VCQVTSLPLPLQPSTTPTEETGNATASPTLRMRTKTVLRPAAHASSSTHRRWSRRGNSRVVAPAVRYSSPRRMAGRWLELCRRHYSTYSQRCSRRVPRSWLHCRAQTSSDHPRRSAHLTTSAFPSDDDYRTTLEPPEHIYNKRIDRQTQQISLRAPPHGEFNGIILKSHYCPSTL